MSIDLSSVKLSRGIYETGERLDVASVLRVLAGLPDVKSSSSSDADGRLHEHVSPVLVGLAKGLATGAADGLAPEAILAHFPAMLGTGGDGQDTDRLRFMIRRALTVDIPAGLDAIGYDSAVIERLRGAGRGEQISRRDLDGLLAALLRDLGHRASEGL
jgi:hypothetical protein